MLKTVEITTEEMIEALRDLGYTISIPGPNIPLRFHDDADFAKWLKSQEALSHILYDNYKPIEQVTGDVYGVTLCTAEPVLTEQVDSLAAYFFEGPFASEYYDTQGIGEVDGRARLFLLNTDFTKSRHDDWTDNIGDLWEMLREGTPIRKTDRKGPGTRGTRAVEGLHCDIWLAFS